MFNLGPVSVDSILRLSMAEGAGCVAHLLGFLTTIQAMRLECVGEWLKVWDLRANCEV